MRMGEPLDARCVLVVDDDGDIRETFSEVLKDEGFPTATAADGQAALDWMRAHPGRTSLVLLDLMMPGMDGYTFLEQREHEPALARVPVVLITATPDQRLASRRVQGCLRKPVTLDVLTSVVRDFA